MIFFKYFSIIILLVAIFVFMKELYVNDFGLLHQDKKEILRKFLKKDGIKLHLLYDSKFESAKILRDYVEVASSLVWLDMRRKSRLILITDEMNNNAIEYGSKQIEKNKLHFEIIKNEKEIYIKIEVEDNGNGKSPKTAEEMNYLRGEKWNENFKNHQSIRGRWLFMIILSLVDNLYFKNNEKWGLIVGIEKTLFLT